MAADPKEDTKAIESRTGMAEYVSEVRQHWKMSRSEEPDGQTNKRSSSGRHMFIAYLVRTNCLRDSMTDREWDKALYQAAILDEIGGRVITFAGLGLMDAGLDEHNCPIEADPDLEQEVADITGYSRHAA